MRRWKCWSCNTSGKERRRLPNLVLQWRWLLSAAIDVCNSLFPSVAVGVVCNSLVEAIGRLLQWWIAARACICKKSLFSLASSVCCSRKPPPHQLRCGWWWNCLRRELSSSCYIIPLNSLIVVEQVKAKGFWFFWCFFPCDEPLVCIDRWKWARRVPTMVLWAILLALPYIHTRVFCFL